GRVPILLLGLRGARPLALLDPGGGTPFVPRTGATSHAGVAHRPLTAIRLELGMAVAQPVVVVAATGVGALLRAGLVSRGLERRTVCQRRRCHPQERGQRRPPRPPVPHRTPPAAAARPNGTRAPRPSRVVRGGQP